MPLILGADGGVDELRWFGLHGFSVTLTRGRPTGSNGDSGAPVDRVPRLVGGTERLRVGMGDQWAGRGCSGREKPALRTSALYLTP